MIIAKWKFGTSVIYLFKTIFTSILTLKYITFSLCFDNIDPSNLALGALLRLMRDLKTKVLETGLLCLHCYRFTCVWRETGLPQRNDNIEMLLKQIINTYSSEILMSFEKEAGKQSMIVRLSRWRQAGHKCVSIVSEVERIGRACLFKWDSTKSFVWL